MSRHPTDRKTLRSFGFLMGFVFFIIAAVLFFKEKTTALTLFGGASAVFVFFALVRPSLLKGIYLRWMKFADVIGRFNAKVILSLVYTVFFTLSRILLFVLRKDTLKKKFDSSLDSYWTDREPIDRNPGRYEKQF